MLLVGALLAVVQSLSDEDIVEIEEVEVARGAGLGIGEVLLIRGRGLGGLVEDGKEATARAPEVFDWLGDRGDFSSDKPTASLRYR